jgi:hypothetical protein
MNQVELHKVLAKISAIALYKFSLGTRDYFALQDYLYKVETRPLVGGVQITDAFHPLSGEINIDFAFSPYFLDATYRMFRGTNLGSLTWRFSLPPYDFGEEDNLQANDSQIAIDNEEGIGSWISRGVITSNTTGAYIDDLQADDLYEMFVDFSALN